MNVYPSRRCSDAQRRCTLALGYVSSNLLPDLPSRSGCPVIGARATRVPPRWRELTGPLGAEDTSEERVVACAPAIEVAGQAVGDLHAKPCGHRRPAHGTEGAPPCD